MKIVYHRSALRDLESIHKFIARENPDAANRVVSRIGQATSRLEDFPYSGRSGPRGIRLLSVTGLPYIVIHRIDGEIVKIVTVFHSSRNRQFRCVRFIAQTPRRALCLRSGAFDETR